MTGVRPFARTMRTATILSSLFGALLLLAMPKASSAQPQLISGLRGPAGYGYADNCLGPNDDQSSPVAINIREAFPAGLHFFDRTHFAMYVNTNGNITFNAPVSTYTPNPFPVANQPMIAPYWGDVDIRRGDDGQCSNADISICRNPIDNGVWWYVEPARWTAADAGTPDAGSDATVDGDVDAEVDSAIDSSVADAGNTATFTPGRIIVTWDNVMFYSCGASHPERRMNFQLIISAPPTCGLPGDFDVEFRYNRCEWEAGTASGGDSGGFGGTEAQAGFDAGNRRDYVSIPGSREAGIAHKLCSESNVGAPGIWRFRIRSGNIGCPGGGTACETGMRGVCANGVTQCGAAQGMGTTCLPTVQSSREVCDLLDNDCNGQTDEGMICPVGQVCSRGQCGEPCSENFCGENYSCDTRDGRCVETGCETVTCETGLRCRGVNGPNGRMGVCEDACGGVRCPDDQVCRSGSCVNPCDSTVCNECTVCVAGQCILPCLEGGCPSGTVCWVDGRCRPADCVNVSCASGQVCRGGSCHDVCDDVRCPGGQACYMGQCRYLSDIPPPSTTDSGRADTGTRDGGGNGPGSGNGGCKCTIQNPSPIGFSGVLLALLTLSFLWRRRSR